MNLSSTFASLRTWSFAALLALAAAAPERAHAQSSDAAGKLASVLASEDRVAKKVDGLIAETGKRPSFWSGTKNAGSVKQRMTMTREAVLGMRPKIVEALRTRLNSTFSQGELESYLAALYGPSAEKAKAHPVAYGADYAFTDVVFNAMIAAAARAQDQLDGPR